MLISGEPGKQQVLNPVLEQLGVQLMNGQLVQPGFDETPDKIISGYRAASLAAVAEHPAARASGKDAVSVHQTSAMGPSGMAAIAIKNDPANDSASVLMPGAARPCIQRQPGVQRPAPRSDHTWRHLAQERPRNWLIQPSPPSTAVKGT